MFYAYNHSKDPHPKKHTRGLVVIWSLDFGLVEPFQGF